MDGAAGHTLDQYQHCLVNVPKTSKENYVESTLLQIRGRRTRFHSLFIPCAVFVLKKTVLEELHFA